MTVSVAIGNRDRMEMKHWFITLNHSDQQRPHERDALQSLAKPHFVGHDCAIVSFDSSACDALPQKLDSLNLVRPQHLGQHGVHHNMHRVLLAAVSVGLIKRQRVIEPMTRTQSLD